MRSGEHGGFFGGFPGKFWGCDSGVFALANVAEVVRMMWRREYEHRGTVSAGAEAGAVCGR